MTDEQRKSVAIEYLKAFDNKGVTSSGGSILDLFADDAQVFFPKWGLANGKEQIGQLFTDFGGNIRHILHDYATFNWIMTGTDVFAVEGTSAGEHKDGPWRAGVTHAGRWCDVFEVRDFLIQRCFIYLDPDYAGLDTARYHWLSQNGPRRLEADGVGYKHRFAPASGAFSCPWSYRSSAARRWPTPQPSAASSRSFVPRAAVTARAPPSSSRR